VAENTRIARFSIFGFRILVFAALVLVACHAPTFANKRTPDAAGAKQLSVDFRKTDLQSCLDTIHLASGYDFIVDKTVLAQTLLSRYHITLYLPDSNLETIMEWLTRQIDAQYRVDVEQKLVTVGDEKTWIKEAQNTCVFYSLEGIVDPESKQNVIGFLKGFGWARHGSIALLKSPPRLMAIQPKFVHARIQRIVNILRAHRIYAPADSSKKNTPVQIPQAMQKVHEVIGFLANACGINIGYDPRDLVRAQVRPLKGPALIGEHLKHIGSQCGLNAQRMEDGRGYWLFKSGVGYHGWTYGQWSWDKFFPAGFDVKKQVRKHGAQQLMDMIKAHVAPAYWDKGGHLDYYEPAGMLVVLGVPLIFKEVSDYLALLDHPD